MVTWQRYRYVILGGSFSLFLVVEVIKFWVQYSDDQSLFFPGISLLLLVLGFISLCVVWPKKTYDAYLAEPAKRFGRETFKRLLDTLQRRDLTTVNWKAYGFFCLSLSESLIVANGLMSETTVYHVDAMLTALVALWLSLIALHDHRQLTDKNQTDQDDDDADDDEDDDENDENYWF